MCASERANRRHNTPGSPYEDNKQSARRAPRGRPVVRLDAVQGLRQPLFAPPDSHVPEFVPVSGHPGARGPRSQEHRNRRVPARLPHRRSRDQVKIHTDSNLHSLTTPDVHRMLTAACLNPNLAVPLWQAAVHSDKRLSPLPTPPLFVLHTPQYTSLPSPAGRLRVRPAPRYSD